MAHSTATLYLEAIVDQSHSIRREQGAEAAHDTLVAHIEQLREVWHERDEYDRVRDEMFKKALALLLPRIDAMLTDMTVPVDAQAQEGES